MGLVWGRRVGGMLRRGRRRSMNWFLLPTSVLYVSSISAPSQSTDCFSSLFLTSSQLSLLLSCLLLLGFYLASSLLLSLLVCCIRVTVTWEFGWGVCSYSYFTRHDDIRLSGQGTSTEK